MKTPKDGRARGAAERRGGLRSGQRSCCLTADCGRVPRLALPTWCSRQLLTKLFTAVLTLQLLDENRLWLDAPVATWYPDVPNASLIRVDHLLRHTSGLVDEDGEELDADYASAGAAGAIASTPSDLITFWKAVLARN